MAFFNHNKIKFGLRVADAFLRGLARGNTMMTFINALGKLVNKDLHLAASITLIPVTIVGTYTSYNLTNSSVNTILKNLETDMAELTVTENSELLPSQPTKNTTTRIVDAIARGLSRTDAVIACMNALGCVIKYDLEIPAFVLGGITLIIGSCSSYQLTMRNAATAALSENTSQQMPIQFQV